MDKKNIEVILKALAEKISELEMEVGLRDFDIRKLKEENEKLRKAVEHFEQALSTEGK